MFIPIWVLSIVLVVTHIAALLLGFLAGQSADHGESD
jgi:hypothetical protein